MKFKIKREAKIGVLVVITLAFFFWGFNFLKGMNFFTSSRIYYAVYDQVNGLVEANWVVINGVKVGEIRHISFIDIKGRVLVEFSVRGNIKIPRNSIARIYNSDILGSKAIEISLGDSTRIDDKNQRIFVLAKDGDTLRSNMQPSITQEVSYQMLPLKMKAEDLMASMDSMIDVIRSVFNESTRENLKRSFESIKNTIKNLEHTTFNLDTLMSMQRNRLAMIIGNVESITSNIKNNNAKLANIIDNFSNISDSLSKAKIVSTISKANDVLKNFSDISEKINKGEGSLGLLINNDTLYNRLDKSSKELNLLLEDIRLNPHRYVHVSVFGKNPKRNQYVAPAGNN